MMSIAWLILTAVNLLVAWVYASGPLRELKPEAYRQFMIGAQTFIAGLDFMLFLFSL